MLADFSDGLITREEVETKILIYKEANKRIQASLAFTGLLIKAGMKADAKRLLKGELLGDASNIKGRLPVYDRTKSRGT
jgi:hypothetical protein